MWALQHALNSREDFDHIKKILATSGMPKSAEPDVKRVAYFCQLIRYSYASGITSFRISQISLCRT